MKPVITRIKWVNIFAHNVTMAYVIYHYSAKLCMSTKAWRTTSGSKLNIQPLDEWGIKEEIKKYIANK